MRSTPERAAQIVAGAAIVGVGLAAARGPAGVVGAVVGLVPIAAGVLNLCLLAPLFGMNLNARERPSH